MITTFIFCVAAGLILICLEIFVPGGILGLIGSVFLIASLIMCFMEFGMRIGIYYIAGLACVIMAVIVLVMRFAHLLPVRKRLFLTATERDMTVEIDDLQLLVGKQGIAYTILRPAGKILIDGKRYEAMAEGSFIQKNSEIEIIRIDGNNIIVRTKS